MVMSSLLCSHLYEHDPRMGEHKVGTLVNDTVGISWWGWFGGCCRLHATWTIVVSQENGFNPVRRQKTTKFPASGKSSYFQLLPGILSIAEESTDWPMVSWPTYIRGITNLKWNMGWMHDMLDYFSMDPSSASSIRTTSRLVCGITIVRTMLALSHDEVVHGKSNIMARCRGIVGRSLATCAVCSLICSPR